MGLILHNRNVISSPLGLRNQFFTICIHKYVFDSAVGLCSVTSSNQTQHNIVDKNIKLDKSQFAVISTWTFQITLYPTTALTISQFYIVFINLKSHNIRSLMLDNHSL